MTPPSSRQIAMHSHARVVRCGGCCAGKVLGGAVRGGGVSPLPPAVPSSACCSGTAVRRPGLPCPSSFMLRGLSSPC